jgi:hypothetical protein
MSYIALIYIALWFLLSLILVPMFGEAAKAHVWCGCRPCCLIASQFNDSSEILTVDRKSAWLHCKRDGQWRQGRNFFNVGVQHPAAAAAAAAAEANDPERQQLNSDLDDDGDQQQQGDEPAEEEEQGGADEHAGLFDIAGNNISMHA